MRPSADTDGKELYECFGCGARMSAPVTRWCESCGSRLRNIGRPRDL